MRLFFFPKNKDVLRQPIRVADAVAQARIDFTGSLSGKNSTTKATAKFSATQIKFSATEVKSRSKSRGKARSRSRSKSRGGGYGHGYHSSGQHGHHEYHLSSAQQEHGHHSSGKHQSRGNKEGR